MIKKLIFSFTGWFQNTAQWWFTTLYGKIGVLFIFAAFSLVLLTYFFTDWRYTGRDDILDAHDAYLYSQLVDSWESPPNLDKAKKELKNLQLRCTIFSSDKDRSCANDTLIFWSNHSFPIELCNYISYSSTEDYFEYHGINYNNYVSFGEMEFKQDMVQATFVEKENFKYLITLDIPPTSPPTFVPFVVVAFISLSVLYQMIRRFLKPIGLLQKRIVALEKGDLDSKIRVVGSDELSVLTKNFNEMVEEIKDLLKQKERLLSDVSHELRTPLSKIRLLINLISPKDKSLLLSAEMKKAGVNIKTISSAKKIFEEANDKLNKIDKNILYLDSIITNILLSDQMSSPYANLKIETSTVAMLIKQASELTFVKDVEVVDKNKILATTIRVDKVKIAIAIKNLLENAYKYTAKTDKIRIYLTKDQKVLNITVKDRGPGLNPELLKTITKRYVRGNHKTKEGVGLGLSICYKVMSAHGGDIEIINNPKGGASFTLKIPHK